MSKIKYKETTEKQGDTAYMRPRQLGKGSHTCPPRLDSM